MKRHISKADAQILADSGWEIAQVLETRKDEYLRQHKDDNDSVSFIIDGIQVLRNLSDICVDRLEEREWRERELMIQESQTR